MKIKLSEILKYCFCRIDENNIQVFLMEDVKALINSAKFMFKTIGETNIEIENDCLTNKGLYGQLKNCAQEMMPGVWMINKLDFVKIVFSSLFEKPEKTTDSVIKRRFIRICTNFIIKSITVSLRLLICSKIFISITKLLYHNKNLLSD